MSEQGKENLDQETVHKPEYEVKIIGADEPTEPTEPVEPTEPTEPENEDAKPVEPTEPTEPKPADEPINEGYDDNKVLEYFKSKGKEITSIDDLFKDPEVKEVVKEVNPYADINFSEDDLQYIGFKKDHPHLGRKEFDFLNQDLNTISPIDLAKQRIERETGEKFSRKDTVDYLEEKFGIDLSDMDSLSIKDKIELKSYTKPELDAMVAQKEKYKQPIEVKPNVGNADDYITLDNGAVMTKKAFKQQQDIRASFLEQVNSLPNSVDKLSFTFNVDDNGVPKEVPFDYELSQKDTQEMVSKLSDIDGAIRKHFSKQDGSVDVKALGIALQFGTQDKLGKLLDDAYQRGRADLAETSSRTENNVNFNGNGLPQKQKAGDYDTKTVPVEEIFNR